MRKLSLFILSALVLAAFTGSAAPASAAVEVAPAWGVTDLAVPSVLPTAVGSKGEYNVVVENIGGAPSPGGFMVSVGIPAGLTVTQRRAEPAEGGPACSESPGEVSCNFSEGVVPGGFVIVQVQFEVTGAVGSLRSVASVSGGGAAAVASDEASMRPAVAPGEKASAGVAQFRMSATGPAGESVGQAGEHPHFLTTSLLLNNMYVEGLAQPVKPIEPVKDLVFYLPIGMLGNPSVTDPCPASLVEVGLETTGCPPSSLVGTIQAMLLGQVFVNTYNPPTHARGIFSVQTEHGYAAEFAFASNKYTFFLYASVVRRDGTYMLRVTTPGVLPGAALVGLVATFDGDIQERFPVGEGEVSYDRGAFLTNPTDCAESSAAREASVAFSTWENPELQPSEETSSSPLFKAFPTFSAIEGCERLKFSAALAAATDTAVSGDTTQADEPSGYKLDLQTPQAPNTGSGLGTPPYQGVDFTFPEGTSLAPGAANGLTSCPASGPNGVNIEGGESEGIAPDGLLRPVAGHCPSSSEVGIARASTPLLREELAGHLYLAEPECGNAAHPNPCTPEDAASGSLYRLYLELEAPERGVIIKLPGKALVNPATGRIMSVFEGTPQFPVTDLTIETSGGPRASLENPQSCGTATTTGLITPWSAPITPPATPSSSFAVTGCSGTTPFAPSFTAGTSSTGAGSYSPFTLTLKREDREQDVSVISSTLPAGLLAAVKNVAQCPEPQASQGACPAASQVGTTTVGVGAGSDPLYQSGQVYFTGPYGGAPFGLSVVVPAVAGPFNLGDVIVRVALFINQNTAQVTAISSPFPQMIDGVPLRIRAVNVTLNDPAFTFNATNCSALSITGAVSSTQGAKTALSTPYEANGCVNLPFKPVFSASTNGKASKAGGASLDVRVTSKGGPQTGGGEANIRSVKVDLPKELPSRLTTLQKACTEAQFNANPAGCPKASDVGTASAATPILVHPLSGPAYLVSHGGAAFPDLEIVLQGEGVVLVLDGNTDIKKGITSSTFKTVPDAPISSFELKLPTGKYSVLGANLPVSASYNLCGQSLSMPTAITGQNGAVVKQTTKIGVAGCPKAKKVTKKKRKAKKASKASHGHKNGRKS